MNEKQIKKLLSPKPLSLILTIVIGVASGVMLFLSIKFKNNNADWYGEPQYFNNLIVSEEEQVDKFVYIDIVYICVFAEESDKSRQYYYVMDDNDFVYIAEIDDKEYDRITEAFDSTGEAYHLEGYTHTIPYDLKALAVNSFGEAFDNSDDILTSDNFEEYFGTVYLSCRENSYTEWAYILRCMSIIGFIVMGGFLVRCIQGVVFARRVRKQFDIDTIKYELLKPSTVKFPKIKIYLTDKYLISKNTGLIVVAEIAKCQKIYTNYIKQKGVDVAVHLLIDTTDGKSMLIGVLKGLWDFDELINLVNERIGVTNNIAIRTVPQK